MRSISERVDKLLKDDKPIQVHLGNHWVDFDGFNYELLKFHRADIREKPEKKLVIGDWWIPYKNAVPEKLTSENIKNYNGTKPYAQYTEAKPWQPKPGEWCWFFSDSVYIPVLAKFQFQHKPSGNFEASNGYAYLSCEPFIGTLPTQLKED